MRQMTITNGKASLTADGLRCRASRVNDEKRVCNKLLAKRNRQGLVAGNFQCERCRQPVEVEIADI